MIKNQHLLIAIVILGFGCAVACLLLLFSERSNSTAITKLSGELLDTRKDLQSSQARLGETNDKLTDIEKKHADLAKQHRTLEEKHANLYGQHEILKGSLTDAKQVLDANKSFLDSLKQKKWLTNSGNVAPWEAQIKTLEALNIAHDVRFKTLEENLKKLTDPPKKEKGPAPPQE